MPNSFINKPARLLLVDDDPIILRLLERIIEKRLDTVVVLSSLTDPREARHWIENHVVDILITDLEMPGINGLELLRVAKRKNPLTQVYFMTGHSTLESLTDALELGATDYLLKPFDQTELLELIAGAQKRLRRWREALAGTFFSKKNKPVQAT